MSGIKLEKVINFDGRNSALILLLEEISIRLPRMNFLMFNKRGSLAALKGRGRGESEYILNQRILGRFIIRAREGIAGLMFILVN